MIFIINRFKFSHFGGDCILLLVAIVSAAWEVNSGRQVIPKIQKINFNSEVFRWAFQSTLSQSEDVMECRYFISLISTLSELYLFIVTFQTTTIDTFAYGLQQQQRRFIGVNCLLRGRASASNFVMTTTPKRHICGPLTHYANEKSPGNWTAHWTIVAGGMIQPVAVGLTNELFLEFRIIVVWRWLIGRTWSRSKTNRLITRIWSFSGLWVFWSYGKQTLTEAIRLSPASW